MFLAPIKTSPKVVFRSKSLHTLNNPNDNPKTNRLSVPIDRSNLIIDDFKRRSAILNTKTFKSNTNLDEFDGKELKNNEKTDYDELFDPSIVFINSYRCRYYDFNRRIRKGKLLLSANELVFKCSGMPFVKAHLKYENIEKVQIIDRYENINTKLLCIEYNNLKKTKILSFYFYRFIVPVKLVKINLKYLIKKSKKYVNIINNDDDYVEKQPEEIIKKDVVVELAKQELSVTKAPTPVDDVPIPYKRKSEQSGNDKKIVHSRSEPLLGLESNNVVKTPTRAVIVEDVEVTTVKKTTVVIIFLFLFMIFFIIINFFKLSELEHEINS
jgi:hypothetical protein